MSKLLSTLKTGKIPKLKVPWIVSLYLPVSGVFVVLPESNQDNVSIDMKHCILRLVNNCLILQEI